MIEQKVAIVAKELSDKIVSELTKNGKYFRVQDMGNKVMLSYSDEAAKKIIDRVSTSYSTALAYESAPKARLFVDMDGTVARFHDEVNYLEMMFEKGFFENLKPFAEMLQALKAFRYEHPNIEMFVLSSTVDGEPPYCQEEKNKWLDRFMPYIDAEHRLLVPVGQRKANFVPNGIKHTDVLFDDYNKNLEEWQADGGTSIKCKNNINHKGLIGKLWEGAIVANVSLDPSEIANNLYNTISDLTKSAAETVEEMEH